MSVVQQLQASMEKSGIWVLALFCIGTVLVWLKSWVRGVILAFRLSGPRALPLIGNAYLAVDTKRMHFEFKNYTIFNFYDL